jgi:hypothetical protein
MAKFTDEQADAAYTSCSIKKVTLDADPAVGHRTMGFTVNGEIYSLEADHDSLPMSSTSDQVKTYFVDFLKKWVEYTPIPPSASATTEVTETKA